MGPPAGVFACLASRSLSSLLFPFRLLPLRAQSPRTHRDPGESQILLHLWLMQITLTYLCFRFQEKKTHWILKLKAGLTMIE